MEFGLLLEHFQNALCGDLRARDHVEEHDEHHERRDDLRGELGEGEHFGEEGGVVVAHDDEAPQPIDGERQAVEDEHHEGVHERHCAACEGVVLLKGGAHLFEAGALVLLRIVGAHDADARERIAQGAVEAVGELLDELEAGQRDGEDGGDAAEQNDDGARRDEGEFAARLGDADDRHARHEGRAHAEAQDEHHRGDDLLDVVGGARQKRARRKRACRAVGKR